MNYLTRCAGGVFVPNTDTILFIGRNGGLRFGAGYKDKMLPDARGGPGGPHEWDPRDKDDYFWAYNVNDIVSATSETDIGLYSYGIFNGNRRDSEDFDIAFDESYFGALHGLTYLSGVTFDPVNKRLYVARGGVDVPTLNNTYARSIMIEVFRLNF